MLLHSLKLPLSLYRSSAEVATVSLKNVRGSFVTILAWLCWLLTASLVAQSRPIPAGTPWVSPAQLAPEHPCRGTHRVRSQEEGPEHPVVLARPLPYSHILTTMDLGGHTGGTEAFTHSLPSSPTARPAPSHHSLSPGHLARPTAWSSLPPSSHGPLLMLVFWKLSQREDHLRTFFPK